MHQTIIGPVILDNVSAVQLTFLALLYFGHDGIREVARVLTLQVLVTLKNVWNDWKRLPRKTCLTVSPRLRHVKHDAGTEDGMWYANDPIAMYRSLHTLPFYDGKKVPYQAGLTQNPSTPFLPTYFGNKH